MPSSLDSLPAKNADAKATQINADVRLRTHPARGLDGAVRFHYTDFDNQTPEIQLKVRVPYDASVQRFGQTGPTDHTNDAFSNKQWHAGVDLDFSPTPPVKVGGTYEYRMRDRTEREVEKDKESVLKGRALWRPRAGLQVDGHYWHGDRKLDEFLDEDYFGLRTRLATTANPTVYDSIGQLEQLELRRFDVADRVQDQAGGGVSWAVMEDLDLSGSYTYIKNDYKNSGMGLRDETANNLALDGTYHVNAKLDLNGGYGYGTLETNQNSRQSGSSIPSTNPLDNWSANLKDKDVYVSAGFDWIPRDRMSLASSYEFSRHIEDFDLANATNNAQDVPSTLYRRHILVVDAGYKWLKNMTVVGRYGWEQYDVVDFATTNVPLIFPTTGTSNAIFLGDSSIPYRATRLALLVKFTF
jgi:putative beta-barrel porin MtrB/PioB